MPHKLSITEFSDEQMKQFSLYDCERSLASIVDGLKITGRKVIHTMCKKYRNVDEIKVAQLAAATAECTDYHHGEASVGTVIVGLAKAYTGSNNINLLDPIGQFGSIITPDGAAAARYINTKLSPNFNLIFNKSDFDILEKQFSDDLEIEPEYFLPIIPLILVNGSEGIGTGYASKIFNRDPKTIIDYCIDILTKNKSKQKLLPAYKGWKGTVVATEQANQYLLFGKLEKVGANKIRITEVPVGFSQAKLTGTLVSLMDDNIINDFDDNSSESNGYDVTVYCPRSLVTKSEAELIDIFKLSSKWSENLTCWLPSGKELTTFESPEDLCNYFIKFRTDKYEERRLYQLEQIKADKDHANEKKRFIELYIKKAKEFSQMTKAEMITLLEANKFTDIPRLLDIKIYNLTKDAIDKLILDISELDNTIKFLTNTTAKAMYELELRELKKNLK